MFHYCLHQRAYAPRFATAIVTAVACLTFSGCGGDMKVAPVSGTVTLDGQPLARASVLFQPSAGGRPSFGVTDQSGQYSLNYSMNESGAEVGECTVKVTTRLQQETAEGEDIDDEGPTAPEKVPAKYAKEPIVVTVEPKSNTINIELSSK